MMRLVAVAGNYCLTIRSLIVLSDNLLISGSEIFIDFSIKRGVRKLPQSFFLVEVVIHISNVVIHISKSKGVAEMTNKTNKIKKKWGFLRLQVLRFIFC